MLHFRSRVIININGNGGRIMAVNCDARHARDSFTRPEVLLNTPIVRHHNGLHGCEALDGLFDVVSCGMETRIESLLKSTSFTDIIVNSSRLQAPQYPIIKAI
ncbi:hypothetical protein MTP99_007918 [Tenebrio molitor]|nr:hypothetical protein MTP99_007918 [Tenebrio molitor]